MSKRAVDGISKNPAHAAGKLIKYIDWITLEREFMIQTDYASVPQWLYHEKGWPIKKITSGNTTKHTTGWGKKRALVQQKITEAAIGEAIKQERRLVPSMRQAKAMLIKNIVKDVGRWDRLPSYEKKLCYDILKIELQEPTNVKDMEPQGVKDPVEALLEEYGLMADGEIIDDDPASDKELIGGSDSGETQAAHSETPEKVPQD